MLHSYSGQPARYAVLPQDFRIRAVRDLHQSEAPVDDKALVVATWIANPWKELSQKSR